MEYGRKPNLFKAWGGLASVMIMLINDQCTFVLKNYGLVLEKNYWIYTTQNSISFLL